MSSLFLLCGLFLAAGASAAVPSFTDIALRNDRSALFCPEAGDGALCQMTQPDALKYCAKLKASLPITREFAMLAQANGSKGLLELVDAKGAPPEGYYKVDSQDGDTFYFNNAGYHAPAGLLGTESFWTATIVTKKPAYAHVYYGKLGGGGGTPEEHARIYRHAVICVIRPQKTSKRPQ